MKHTIEVNGIKIYAFHGCLPEEEKIGGWRGGAILGRSWGNIL
jgi:hypothetical protein